MIAARVNNIGAHGVCVCVCCLVTVSQVKSLIQLSYTGFSLKLSGEAIQGLLVSVVQHKLDCITTAFESESIRIR